MRIFVKKKKKKPNRLFGLQREEEEMQTDSVVQLMRQQWAPHYPPTPLSEFEGDLSHDMLRFLFFFYIFLMTGQKKKENRK